MGWWNATIYGGDTALDWREKIYLACEAPEYGEDHNEIPVPTELLSNKVSEIIKLIDENSDDEDDKNIGYQVLGAIIMHSGFDIDESEGLRDRIIKASEDDDYAKDDFLRKNVMKNFKKLIKDYDCSQPINVMAVNILEETEDDDEQIAKEFKQVFELMKARMKKLESGKEEKSGSEDYDQGFSDANQEEIDFLKDFMDLMSKFEMMGVLFEKIAQGLVGNPVSSGSGDMAKSASPMGKASSNSSPGAGKDIMPG
jgi:hypothetical protein